MQQKQTFKVWCIEYDLLIDCDNWMLIGARIAFIFSWMIGSWDLVTDEHERRVSDVV